MTRCISSLTNGITYARNRKTTLTDFIISLSFNKTLIFHQICIIYSIDISNVAHSGNLPPTYTLFPTPQPPHHIFTYSSQ